jgi:hypothetical protein
MTSPSFATLEEARQSGGPAATIERLIGVLREQKEFHKLFDALLLKRKFEMGLPLSRPTSFDDVPAERQAEFESSYVAAAREVGNLLLASGEIPQAWLYFRTIREPQAVADAIARLDVSSEYSERTDSIINVALYEGANPVKGLEMLLRTHGTCNTITAFDQQIHQIQPVDRGRAAALLVRDVYQGLASNVRREIEHKQGQSPLDASLHDLLCGRDWLFADGNYHIDVSHLNSVVRFARFLEGADPELALAMELAEYGSHLAQQFQYPADAPFDDYYPAHLNYFQVVADKDREAGLDYFRGKLAATEDERDRPLVAFVLVDLLVRIGRDAEALAIAEQHLKHVEEPSGFSFGELCRRVGRLDTLRSAARERGDLVAYAAALIEDAGKV